MTDAFVLVVDDNPETLAFLVRALEAEGLKVLAVNSVFKALEALHDGTPRPSVIVTDLMMPRTTGWDFLKHLRSETTLQGLPVIVITGADVGDNEELANVVLQKPIDPVHLAETVRSMMLLPSS